MIKLSEVRVGNIVCCNSGMPGTNKPEPLAPWMIRPLASFPNGECQNYDYVPITQSFLILNGWRVETFAGQKYFFPNENALWSIRLENPKKGIYILITRLDTFGREVTKFGRPLKFVHNIQNIYYELIGEELQIKDI
jgi:hypothetical protein